MAVMSSIVSIIVPIYNVEKYLQPCIDSICTQTYPYLEIILVNDGSTDRCADICDKNALRDSRIIVIHKENGGLSSARNAGLDCATGEYVAFVDSDDTIHPQFIENLVGLCEQYNCDIALCDFLGITEDSIKLPINKNKIIQFYDNRQALYKLCGGIEAVKYSVAWNKVYKRMLFNEIRYPVGRIHEDEFIAHLLLWKAKKIAVTNQYMYYYLQHPTSIMRKPFSINRLDVLDAFRKRLCFFKENNLEKEYTATLGKLLYLIEKNYKLLKKYVKNSEEICIQLLEEKEKILNQLTVNSEKENNSEIDYLEIDRNSYYFQDSKIILYGAGNWGHIYYQWISQNNYAEVVGWVDNYWYIMDETEYPIMPLDLLLRISYDYVLITIKSKSIQNEVRKNLISWGIAKEKILSICTDLSEI